MLNLKSKRWWQFDKNFEALFYFEKYVEHINSMHFKTHYAGRPTKQIFKIDEIDRRSRTIKPGKFGIFEKDIIYIKSE